MSYQVPDETRFELKFVTSTLNLFSILHWVRMHPEGFRKAYPDRWINNVYFDSPDCVAYSENLAGESSRSKTRYRWYGNSSFPQSGTLEIKNKRSLFVWKKLFKVKQSPYAEGDNWRTITNNIKNQLAPEDRHWLETFSDPILINRYHRRYFLSNDNKVRITVDDQQKVFEQRYKSSPNWKHAANHPESLIVEVKFDRQEREHASQILKDIPIRYSRHSKYMTGFAAIQD